jgi:hypothetical protein
VLRAARSCPAFAGLLKTPEHWGLEARICAEVRGGLVRLAPRGKFWATAWVISKLTNRWPGE